MRYIIICGLLILILLMTGCSDNNEDVTFMKMAYAQQVAIGQCEFREMQFVGLNINGYETFSVICKTYSPVKYYEYKFLLPK